MNHQHYISFGSINKHTALANAAKKEEKRDKKGKKRIKKTKKAKKGTKRRTTILTKNGHEKEHQREKRTKNDKTMTNKGTLK